MQQKVTVLQQEPMQRLWMQRRLSRGIAVDLGAGTQSFKEEAESKGLLYVPIDIEEWVYSASRGRWMHNLAVDARGPPHQVWNNIRKAALLAWSLDLGAQPVKARLLWMSPPCRTFTKMDRTNASRGWNRRDHTMPSAPPLKGRRGDMARLHDGLVQDWIALAQVWGVQGHLLWGLENPQGLLCKRPYMQALTKQCNHRLVHYCAYGRMDQKPTHLWTNAQWVPKGTTGSGECAQRRCWAVLPGTRQHTHDVTGGTGRKRPAGHRSRCNPMVRTVIF